MQVEIKIKSILKDSKTAKEMVDEICSFMNWNRDELLEAIKKYGCSSRESRGKIIAVFWN